ncbi:MAG: addiction module toxin RelE/StbE family [Fusobacteria bacterium]|nr:MAG: addiction module toxin RelE/StbE family [Fusobacteriota bacterium]KAF0228821.1 MAG: addiction module toxin RelE/StbE [Fusobacteriota bacterium]
MARLLLSPKAYIDIRSIQEYIEQELENPKAAKIIVDKIIKGINNLTDYPLSGISLKNKIDIPNEYRYLIIGSYISFYRYVDDTIIVDRILYGGRDFVKSLFGIIPEVSNN